IISVVKEMCGAKPLNFSNHILTTNGGMPEFYVLYFPEFEVLQIWTKRGTMMIEAGGVRFTKDRSKDGATSVLFFILDSMPVFSITKTGSTVILMGNSTRFILGPTFIRSRFGNPIIKVGEYQFCRKKANGGKISWTCRKYYAGCRARLTTRENVIID
ncbi:hypothetical protein ACJJTC_009953, partial [Scirpophaga incertulas]